MAGTTRAHGFVPGSADDQVLTALAQFYYLTVEQLVRLYYSAGSVTGVQSRLKRLTDAGYCITTVALRRRARAGSVPFVYALTQMGRRYVESLGVEIEQRFRPGEVEERDDPFIRHTLAANDVLIALQLLCKAHPHLSIARSRHERVLKRKPVYVQAGDRRIGVVPDGWYEVREDVPGEKPYFSAIALELDTGSLDWQKRWRTKARNLVAWAEGPYRNAFDSKTLVIAVVAVPGEKRKENLLSWTEAELKAIGKERRGSLFRFIGAGAATMTPEEFFLEPRWVTPFTRNLVSLVLTEATPV